MRSSAIALLMTVFALCAVACQKTSKSGTAFDTPQEAADALIEAASANDVPELLEILGPDGKDLVASGDPVQDKNRATAFAIKAKEKTKLELDPKDRARVTLFVGRDDWPLPIPIVQREKRFFFDTEAGHDEVLKRRIGANELEVLNVMRGYVEAQHEYASQTHDDAKVNQYAQRVISTPGKHDGLAWQNPDGTWGGPVGKGAASAIEQGYAQKKPLFGYYFNILKGQGPSAPLGKLDYLVDGAMIGGFALVAWPADYEVTGIQTFIVGYDGTVYQKDLGPKTAEIASAMDRYDPDDSWKRTDDGL